jgi:nucleotide-binding universal stress UspA family protein
VKGAAALADALDLQLVLLHVCERARVAVAGPMPTPVPALDGATPAARAAARVLIGEVARDAGRVAPGAACARLEEGVAGERLREAGRDERAALIAITAARHGPIISALLGSVARDVTRLADRPVLVWPRRPVPGLGRPPTALRERRSFRAG